MQQQYGTFIPDYETCSSLPVRRLQLITASSRGIDRAIALELATNGISVVIKNTQEGSTLDVLTEAKKTVAALGVMLRLMYSFL